MTTSRLPYDQWLEEALRGVIRRALTYTAENGLPDAHHFYITFATGASGVDLPAELRAKYPEEMTIVLQHQFWDLTVDDESFAVTLKFRGRPTRINVPLAAIAAFGDPSVNFGLQLKTLEVEAIDGGHDVSAPGEPIDRPASALAPTSSQPPAQGEVISLDTFRKK